MPPQLGTFTPSSTAARCRQVLIVEDNVDQAQTLRMFLGMKGHRFEVAASGPAALELARRSVPTSCCSISACPASTASKWRAS